MPPNLDAVRSYLLSLQDLVCAGLEGADGAGRFVEDVWNREEGGGGRTRLVADGAVFEKAGVAFSHVRGKNLPAQASARHPELAGRPWQALGVSIVVHPRNPFVPTSHGNVRCFWVDGDEVGDGGEGPPALAEGEAGAAGDEGPPSLAGRELRRTKRASRSEATFWFGGGFDLTPYYGFMQDAIDWHRNARQAVAEFGDDVYPRFKRACDEYFFLKHRGEARGIGGLFFDDLYHLGFERSFALTRSVGDAYLRGYLPIVARRKATPYGEAERNFQLRRRGRYVEFNLLWDRGTLFGLQSGGRTESILMSLPPLVRWDYDWQAAPGTSEARLVEDYLRPRNWLAEGHAPRS